VRGGHISLDLDTLASPQRVRTRSLRATALALDHPAANRDLKKRALKTWSSNFVFISPINDRFCSALCEIQL